MLRAKLADVLEDASNELPGRARLVVQRAFEHWRELDEHLSWCDKQIGMHVQSSDAAQRAAKVAGIGAIGASALTAGVGDFKQFKSAHQFSAWLGVVPSQNSSGGKASLGRITKRGDDYLRTLLIQGAKSVVMSADKRQDATSKWLQQLQARVGWQKACVAKSQQERAHPVGGDDARAGLRCAARQRQAAWQSGPAGADEQGANASASANTRLSGLSAE